MATSPSRMIRAATARGGLLLGLLFAAFSCQREESDPTGGETHFLVRCEPSASSCGDRLVCLCGVCTVPCTERATCELLPAAACVASNGSNGCSAAETQGHCDVACLIDADCAVLSNTHRCELGACRAGTLPGDGAGSAGSGGLAGAASAEPASACVRGQVTGNEVLVIGDSFFASSHQITAYLEALARDSGALPPGGRYRDNSRLTANSLASNGIAEQYETASAEAGVKVVIMNGGGADILISPCATVDASCPAIVAAASAAEELLSGMAADGVLQVVYAFYPDPLDATVRAKLDALRPLLESACENSAVTCHWLDLRTTFTDHYAEYIQVGGINPTEAGSQASAQAIWTLMQRECIAQ